MNFESSTKGKTASFQMTKMEIHSESGNKTGTIAHYIHKDDESSTESKPASSKRLRRKHTSY